MDARHPRSAIAGALTVLLLAGCTAVGRPAVTLSAAPTVVPATASASQLPTIRASPTHSAPAPTPLRALTAAEAVRLVEASDPRFAGIPLRGTTGPRLTTFATAAPATAGAFTVQIHVGSGDCPAGCIDSDTWTFRVTSDRQVALVSGPESPLPSAALGVSGHVTAGPTCPVERNPPDPKCRERPVVGAVIVARDAAGAEVSRATSTADGSYVLALAPGSYTLTPGDVPGLMGTAQPAQVYVVAGKGATVDFSYDTGIR
jgi:hypothetical protein